MSNLTAVLKEKQIFKYEKRKIPTPRPNEVLLKVSVVGICGSDVHYWWEGRCGRFVVDSPLVLGHETSATVVECGSEVDELQPGDRVAIEPGVPCRKCKLCKTGRYNICQEVQFHATPPIDGSLSQYICHPADFCFKLPPNVSNTEGALLEPLAVAVYSCQRARVTSGSDVLITGAGPIGVLCLLVAKSMGARTVTITDISDSRLKFAKDVGATHVLNVLNLSDVEASTKLIHITRTRPTAVLECSGAEMSYRIALLTGAPSCVMATVGRGVQEPKLPIKDFICKQMEIVGIFRYANCYDTALEMISKKQINLSLVLAMSEHFKFSQVEEAFQKSREGNVIKVLIHVN